MTLCYSLVCKDKTPLCQYCGVLGNFDLYYQKFLSLTESNEDITLFKSDGYIWGIKKTPEDLNFLCVVRDSCDKDIIVKILNEMRNKFLKNYGSVWKEATRFSLQSAFEPFLIEISNLLPQQPLTVDDIVPATANEIDMSDASDFLIQSAEKQGLNQTGTCGNMKRWLCKYKCYIFVGILLLIFLIYFILTIYCRSFTLSGCGIEAEGVEDAPLG